MGCAEDIGEGPDRPTCEAKFFDAVRRCVQGADQGNPVLGPDQTQNKIAAVLIDPQVGLGDARSQHDGICPGEVLDRVLPIAKAEPVDIVAGDIGQGVIALRSGCIVVVGTAFDGVIPASGLDGVVTCARVDVFSLTVAGQRLAKVGSVQNRFESRGHVGQIGMGPDGPVVEANLFDHGIRISQGILNDDPVFGAGDPQMQVRADAENGEVRRHQRRVDHNGVDAAGFRNGFVAAADAKAVNVTAKSAAQQIGPRAAGQVIGLITPDQLVGPRPPDQGVVARAPADRVAAGKPVDNVIKVRADNDIGPAAACRGKGYEVRVRPLLTSGKSNRFNCLCAVTQRADQMNSILGARDDEGDRAALDPCDLHVSRSDPGAELQPVKARQIGDLVKPVTKVEPVGVVARGIEQEIIALLTDEDIVTTHSIERVGKIGPGDGVVGIRRRDQLTAERNGATQQLDPIPNGAVVKPHLGDHVVGHAVFDGDPVLGSGDLQDQVTGPVGGLFDDDIGGQDRGIKDNRIAARGPAAVVDEILSEPGREQIRVVAAPAIDGVVSGAAVQRVVAGIGKKRVIARVADERIVAEIAGDVVVTRPAFGQRRIVPFDEGSIDKVSYFKDIGLRPDRSVVKADLVELEIEDRQAVFGAVDAENDRPAFKLALDPHIGWQNARLENDRGNRLGRGLEVDEVLSKARAKDEIRAAVEVAEPVVSGAAVDRVKTRPAIDFVVAAIARQGVVAAVARDRLEICITCQRLCGAVTRQIFHRQRNGQRHQVAERQDRPIGLEHNLIDRSDKHAFTGLVERQIHEEDVVRADEGQQQFTKVAILVDDEIRRQESGIEDDGIDVDPVSALTLVFKEEVPVKEPVLAETHREPVGIAALTSLEFIVARTACQIIVAVAAEQLVITACPVDGVVAVSREKGFVQTGSDHDVVGGGLLGRNDLAIGVKRHRAGQQFRQIPRRPVVKAHFVDAAAQRQGQGPVDDGQAVRAPRDQQDQVVAILGDRDIQRINRTVEYDRVEIGQRVVTTVVKPVLPKAARQFVDVVAAKAPEQVIARSARNGLAGIGAVQGVVTAAALHPAAAGQAVQRVIACPAQKQIGRRIPLNVGTNRARIGRRGGHHVGVTQRHTVAGKDNGFHRARSVAAKGTENPQFVFRTGDAQDQVIAVLMDRNIR